VRRSKQSARYFLFGLGSFAVIVLFLFTALTANSGTLPWVSPPTVRAAFTDIGQLQVGSEVRQNGEHAGQVSAIQTEHGQQIVTMQLVGGMSPMYRDGYAGIWDQSPLQQKYVELRPGTPQSGPLGTGVIPASQTEPSHDVEELFDVFDPATRQSLRTALRQLGGGIAGYGPGFHDFLGTLPGAVDQVRTVADTVSSDDFHLPRLLSSTDRLATRFAGREPQLTELVSQTDATLRALDVDGGKPLGSTLAKLPTTMRAVRGALTDIRPSLTDVATATGELDQGGGARSLGQATPDLRGVFREAQAPLHEVPDFSDDAKPAVGNLQDTFSDLRPFVPRLGDGVHSLRPLLGTLAPYSLDIGTLATDLESLDQEHSGWDHGFRANLVLPGATSLEQSPIVGTHDSYPAPGQATRERAKFGMLPFNPKSKGN
jgi:phospholipid/cholesterol/gamma-HCH transport system substrate-binding protein